MRIKKTLFTKEIEITPDELFKLLHDFELKDNIWKWICKELGIKSIREI